MTSLKPQCRGNVHRNLTSFLSSRLRASPVDGWSLLAATTSDVCVTSVDVPATWEGFSEVGHDIAACSCHLSETLHKSSTSRSLKLGSSLLALGVA